MYIKRQIEKEIKSSFKSYKVVLLTGPRQSGKTRVLREIFKNFKYINFDDVFYENLARNDGLLFLNNNPYPLIIDEVQRVPEIFRFIKLKVDEEEGYGKYILSGSQLFNLMKLSSESLAGRVHIIELPTLSLRELQNIDFNNHFVPNKNYINKRSKVAKVLDKNIWKIIHKGSYPEMNATEKDFRKFYSDYIKTYIERDLRDVLKVTNLTDFQNFLISIAARTGEILNISNIASELRKDEKTIKSWISVLETSGIIYLLKPYHNTYFKRIIKKPKLYFRDTGLCAYLTNWNTYESLMTGAMSGHMFETFVVSEIIKSYANEGIDYNRCLFYYNGRDNKRGEQQEIDLIIEEDGMIYPIEIKETTAPSTNMVKSFDNIDHILDKKRAIGTIICSVKEHCLISKDVQAIPLNFL